MYKVLITGALHPLAIDSLKAEPDIDLVYKPDLPMDEIKKIAADFDCMVSRSETPVKKDLIDCSPKLKVIARAAVGYGNIDVDYATEKGILVFNTPAKNTNSAAELTFGLLLAVIRNIHLADKNMRNGGWDRHRFNGRELTGKTIGLIGLGNVGHRMARFCQGFDMKVLAYDPYIPDETFKVNRAEKTDLETLIKSSDIISVHVPKNKETVNMIAREHFLKMKDSVIILNAARGGIINEADLLEFLKNGKVSGAGIDTWDEEPPVNNPFAKLDNVVMTPHIGASTEEAQYRIAEFLAAELPKALRGGVVESPVNMPQIRMLEGNLMSSYVVLSEKLGLFAAQFMDFKADMLKCIFRGDISGKDCRLLRLAFLKGYLGYASEYVGYVNAELRAKSLGLHVSDVEDPLFNDYSGAVKFVLSGEGREFEIGGVVFPGPHPRITLVDGYVYEAAPEGNFLLVRAHNKLGVLSDISSVLDKHSMLINRIDFSESKTRKRTMFMFKLASPVTDELIGELSKLDGVSMARRIKI